MPVGVGDDERAVVRGHGHPVRERDVLGHDAGRSPSGVTSATKPGCTGPSGGPAANSKLPLLTYALPRPSTTMSLQPNGDEPGQVGVVRELAVGFEGEQRPRLVGDEDGPPVGQEVEAQRQRLVRHDQLPRAGVVDRDDLAGDPVAEPQPAVVPARRLHQAEAGAQDVHLSGCGRRR